MLTPAHVELYCRIKSNPYDHAGYATDAATLYCDLIEKRLDKLDQWTREFIILAAMGYTHQEIALMRNISLRTLTRRNKSVWKPFLDQRAKLYDH